MDPRARRSRDRLTAVVLELAAAGRVDDVSVSEVARAADVTRDTFYRHASSVTELLSLALSERLVAYLEEYTSTMPEPGDLTPVLARAEVGLLTHIAGLGDVYRTALGGQSATPVRRALTGFLQTNIEIALRTYPDIAPLPAEQLDDRSISMIAAYAASGTVGAIEAWLTSRDIDDPAEASRIIAAGAPLWWTRATGRTK